MCMFTMTGSVEPPTLLLCHSFPYLFFFFFYFFFFFVFPDLSVLSTLFLGQIRLSCIPDIPAAYVRNSIQLLWARTVSPSFPSLYPSPTSSVSAHLHLVCTGRGQTWLHCRDHPHLHSALPLSSPPHILSAPLLLLLSVLALSEQGSQTQPHDSQCGRP